VRGVYSISIKYRQTESLLTELWDRGLGENRETRAKKKGGEN